MSELRNKFTELFSTPYGVEYNHDVHEFVPQFTGVERDAFIYQQKWEAFKAGYTMAEKQHLHVGYTNGANIKLLQETDYGAMYSDTKEGCYIPLYMKQGHIHRIETTGGDKQTEDRVNQRYIVREWI